MQRLLKKIFIILLMYFTLVICDSTGIKKYIVVLGLTLVFAFLGRKNKWKPEILICVAAPAVVYLIVGGISSIIGAGIYASSIKIILFWMIPLMFSFSLYIFDVNGIDEMVNAQMLGCCCTYFTVSGRYLMNIGRAESTLSFLFGLFFLYYMYKKHWWGMLLTSIFLFLTGKRITILAILIVLVIRILLKIFRDDKRLVYAIWTMVMGAIGGYVWLICSGTFEFLCTGFGIDTSGRVKTYAQIIEWLGNPLQLIGNGLGCVETLLGEWNIKSFANLHNDLLKFYIELGCIGLLVYLLSYVAVFSFSEKKLGSKKTVMMLGLHIYSVVLFATDNVSIYILYLIPFYTIMLAILSSKQELSENFLKVKNVRKNYYKIKEK